MRNGRIPAFLLILLAFWLLFGWVHCAHPVIPTGGPKDVTPPQAIDINPPNYSTGFDKKKITIEFDEFIELKDIYSEAFISPPLEKKPDFKLKGKSVVIEFDEVLKENTTYTIFFGNAIVDLTENNPASNFEYVFSTGDELDSLSVSGKVIHAFNLEPAKDALVMLYKDVNDSLPLDSLPLSVKPLNAFKTDDSGHFLLNNLGSGDYLLFALKDANGNFIYDQPGEQIAWIDSLIQPVYIPKPVIDTNQVDSTETQTGLENYEDNFEMTEYTLLMFDEPTTVQRLLDEAVVAEDQLRLYFSLPVNSITIDPIGQALPPDWGTPVFNNQGDTLTLWLRGVETDTLMLAINADDLVVDTVRMILRKPLNPRLKKKQKPQKLSFKSNLRGRLLDLDKDLTIRASSPIAEYSPGQIELYTEEDTLALEIDFLDSLQLKVRIDHTWDKGSKYEILVRDSTFISWNSFSHDSLKFRFETPEPGDYGNVFLDIAFPETEGQYIFQLLDNNENIVKHKMMSEPGELAFFFVWPGKYRVKAIHDRNLNGRWDPGNYRDKLQPESIYYFPVPFDVRANWDVQEKWELL